MSIFSQLEENVMRVLCAVFVTVSMAGSVRAAGPHNVIKPGTPISLGQYCTAVNGSSQNCESLLGAFESECIKVGMQFVHGTQRGGGPQNRCILK